MNNKTKVTIRSADKRQKTGLFATWVLMIGDVIAKRELIWQLFVRDFWMSNRRTFLGNIWLFIGPIFSIISWMFLNMAGLLNPGELSVPYPIYLLTGTFIWGMFSGTLYATKDTLQITMSYVSVVNFPREIIIVKQILQVVVTSALSFIMIYILMLVCHCTPTAWVFALPILNLPIVLLAAGIGCILSVLRVVFPDVDRVLGQLIPLLMYTAPIICSPEVANAKIAFVFKYNPLTYLIGIPRDTILSGGMHQPWVAFMYCALASLLFFLFALRVFYVSEEIVIERLY